MFRVCSSDLRAQTFFKYCYIHTYVSIMLEISVGPLSKQVLLDIFLGPGLGNELGMINFSKDFN